MIRFKKAVAADVPLPPAGYVTLFVDTATGQPSAKDSAGVVVSLKGADGEDGDDGAAGLPEGGTVGQFLMRSAEGAAWSDAPAGEGGSAFVNVLADAYFVVGNEPTPDPHSFAHVQYEYETSGASRGVEIKYPVPAGKRVDRVRLTIQETLSGTFDYMEHTGDIDGMPALSNNETGTFTVDVQAYTNEGFVTLGAGVALIREGGEEDLPFVAFLGFELLAFEVRLSDDETASDIDPLALTTIPVIALDNGGSGGSRIPKADHPGATVIEILGYYDFPAGSLLAAGEFYPPAWPESGYVAVTPTAIDSTFDSGDAWGWFGGAEPIAFPEQQHYLCKVSIDGAAPVFALLNAVGGV